eukprot:CAMPEP_0174984910 /NCGR_PEP_ID=MMETSP0004_2-20121128/18016_1 /TAXON_ID=420556 /ORGANISM="Ochromonas sp., Strain CCMP1393" /LENGTH=220 /DNA_ID=CAMNT_0016237435 /DNA_START=16 /DNA_END=675 /DNA_ORIENTATION=-
MGDNDGDDEQMATALRVFAHYLGIDLDNELDLLPVAEEAFYNLPNDWEVGIGEGEHAGIPYFYNAQTGESDWKHPREEMCFRRVKAAKEKKLQRERDNNRSPRSAGGRGRGRSNRSRNDRERSVDSRQAVAEKETTEVEEIEDEDEVVEVDPATVEQPEPMSNNDKAEKRSNRPGFGMRNEDFLDGNDDQQQQHVRSQSPPMFKEQQDQQQGRGDRNRRT